MSDFKLSGRIIERYKTEQVSDKFKKRAFVIETHEQYPQQIKLEVTQDKCDDLEKYLIGDFVDVHFNIRGRGWKSPKTEKTEYFNTLQVWKIAKQNERAETISQNKEAMKQEAVNFDSDELPF